MNKILRHHINIFKSASKRKQFFWLGWTTLQFCIWSVNRSTVDGPWSTEVNQNDRHSQGPSPPSIISIRYQRIKWSILQSINWSTGNGNFSKFRWMTVFSVSVVFSSRLYRKALHPRLKVEVPKVHGQTLFMSNWYCGVIQRLAVVIYKGWRFRLGHSSATLKWSLNNQDFWVGQRGFPRVRSPNITLDLFFALEIRINNRVKELLTGYVTLSFDSLIETTHDSIVT